MKNFILQTKKIYCLQFFSFLFNIIADEEINFLSSVQTDRLIAVYEYGFL